MLPARSYPSDTPLRITLTPSPPLTLLTPSGRTKHFNPPNPDVWYSITRVLVPLGLLYAYRRGDPSSRTECQTAITAMRTSRIDSPGCSRTRTDTYVRVRTARRTPGLPRYRGTAHTIKTTDATYTSSGHRAANAPIIRDRTDPVCRKSAQVHRSVENAPQP
jgi:hypothetical protein